MKPFTYYYVDPPSYEGNGEGEDHREWFTSLAAATRRYNHWLKEIKRDQSDESGNRDFRVHTVTLCRVSVTPTKAGILKKLNRGFRYDEKLQDNYGAG